MKYHYPCDELPLTKPPPAIGMSNYMHLLISGDWSYYNCNDTFIHFQRVQDIRLSEALDVNCYCVLFDPNLTPSDLSRSQVVYRYYIGTASWPLWLELGYSQWADTSYSYPRFKVQEDTSLLVETSSANITEDWDANINVHVGKAHTI